MSKRYVLATDVLTAAQEIELRKKIGTGGYWHWLPNFWLLKFSDPSVNAEKIRDWVKEIAPTARSWVSEVEPVAPWAGSFKPDAQGRDMGAWMTSDWESN